jgi:hypothetical protein
VCLYLYIHKLYINIHKLYINIHIHTYIDIEQCIFIHKYTGKAHNNELINQYGYNMIQLIVSNVIITCICIFMFIHISVYIHRYVYMHIHSQIYR